MQRVNMQEKVVAVGNPGGPHFSLLLGDFLRKKLQSEKIKCKVFRFSGGILKKCLLPTFTTIRTITLGASTQGP